MSSVQLNRILTSLTDLDLALRVTDITLETIAALSDRLERSTLPRHFLLREAELDDLWRAAEVAVRQAEAESEAPATVHALEDLLATVMRAHDLAGDGRVAEATATLRSAPALLPNGEKK